MGTAEKQYFVFREEEGQEGDMLAPLDGPGEEVEFYESEKPGEEYNPGEDGGCRKGEQKHFGEQRMKEDRKEWVTRGTERKVRVEKREEGGRKKMEGQWILTWKEKKGGATEVGPGRLEGGKRRGEVASEEGWDEEYRLTANNGKYVVTLHVDNGSGRQEE